MFCIGQKVKCIISYWPSMITEGGIYTVCEVGEGEHEGRFRLEGVFWTYTEPKSTTLAWFGTANFKAISMKIDPSWLTSTVCDLVNTIHDTQNWMLLPILADALLDAGYDGEQHHLTHLRIEIEHPYGPCYVVMNLMEVIQEQTNASVNERLAAARYEQFRRGAFPAILFPITEDE